ncbi:MAG: small subunit ribosomal protein S17 [Microgenomates group bacterium Gr01-1014_16]|nr:MAG: small subunit ribosomal protein S17 [Microgenomates group bacterium Gr01-1014_16]
MKTLVGKVISNKMEKTVVVEVVRTITHPKYNKRVRRVKKYHAHDELKSKLGDTVKMKEIKPMSKTKFFKVVEITKNATA